MFIDFAQLHLTVVIQNPPEIQDVTHDFLGRDKSLGSVIAV
jgi:hypothetical protein